MVTNFFTAQSRNRESLAFETRRSELTLKQRLDKYTALFNDEFSNNICSGILSAGVYVLTLRNTAVPLFSRSSAPKDFISNVWRTPELKRFVVSSKVYTEWNITIRRLQRCLVVTVYTTMNTGATTVRK